MDSNHTCLAVICLDSTLKKDENYYPQVFLKECKYIEKKVIRYINDNLSDFFLSMSLMKNVLKLVRLVSKNIEHYFWKGECTQKRCGVFLKLCLKYSKIHYTMFTIH